MDIPLRDLAPGRAPGRLAAPTRTERAARAQHPVALVSMPFATRRRPSIQLGLLAAIASQQGFPVTAMHLNLDFARQVGPQPYEAIFRFGRNLGIGDWVFSAAAFADDPDPRHAMLGLYPEELPELLNGIGRSAEYLVELREREVPRYLDRLMEAVEWGRFAVVGFSCCFAQNTASFALAGRIKRAYPHVTTVFGGPNFDGEVGCELVRAVDCIDYAVVGEGDLAFPELLVAHQEGRDPADVAGVACRRGGAVREPRRRPLLSGLDELPFPVYEEWFERAEALRLMPAAGRADVEVLFESARGCWWGQKHHCTFCGLNGTGMAFRAKTPERVRAELDHAAARYGTRRFFSTDNIMDMSYLRTLLPALAADDPGYSLFYELKANLSREQVGLLRRAGVHRAQSGIESLSTHVLQLMDKGVTGIQNINLLRWARYFGISLRWNVLYGFPGETAEDYQRLAATMRHLTHLEPPLACCRVDMERFSPMYEDPARFPVRYRRPRATYRHIYPASVDLEKIAHIFEHEFEQALPDAVYAPTRNAVRSWYAAWERRPSLTFERVDGDVLIVDDRAAGGPEVLAVAEPLASVYDALSDRPRNAAKVAAELDLREPVAELVGALDEFCARGLMVREGSTFLSLALPRPGPRA